MSELCHIPPETPNADVAYLFSKPGRLVRTILAMNVMGPIVAIIVCRLFDLHPALIVALAVSSVPGRDRTVLAFATVSRPLPWTLHCKVCYFAL